MIYIIIHAKLFTGGSVEQYIAEKKNPRYSDVVLPDGESIHPCTKDAEFSVCLTFLKYISS